MRSKRNFYPALFVLCLAPLGQIVLDIYTPSLPTIATSFHITTGMAQFSVTICILFYSILQIFYGPISDKVGRKKPLLFALIIFLLGSITCSFANSIGILILGRTLQGIGTAGTSVFYKVIAADNYQGKRLAYLYTYAALLAGISPVLAPVIGAYIQVHLNWQYNFLFLAIYAVLLLLLFIKLPESHAERRQFHLTQYKQDIKSLFRDRNFIAGVLGGASILVLMMVFGIIAPFIVQDVLHQSVMTYGHVAMVTGIAFICGSLVNRILLRKLSLELINSSVFIIMLCASCYLLICTLNHLVTLTNLTLVAFVIFMGIGGLYPNCLMMALRAGTNIRGTVSALFGTLAMGTAGLAILIASFIPVHSALPLASFFTVFTLVALFGLFFRRGTECVAT